MRGLLIGLTVVALWSARAAQAACGAVSCFVVINSQQQVPQKGTMTMNLFYNYVPQRSLLEGTTGVIPAVHQDHREIHLNDHKELTTITQTTTLDLNYGLTDRLGLQVTVPYIKRRHEHLDEGGAGPNRQFSDGSLGDIRVTAKYNVAPSLRQSVVLGFGLDLPSGETEAREGGTGLRMEPSIQTGRGQVGLVGSLYQTYAITPQLSEFVFGSYRHTFRNNDGYQFGDEYLLNIGLHYMPISRVTFLAQVNYRYLTHDNFSGAVEDVDPIIRSRPVPNTGSTYLAVTPGVQVSVSELTSLYFYSQVPVARDFNNNLAQGTSFVFGLTRFFPNLFGG
jgi:hypothetical protein